MLPLSPQLPFHSQSRGLSTALGFISGKVVPQPKDRGNPRTVKTKNSLQRKEPLMWGRGIHTRCEGGIWDVGRGLGGRSASLALRTPGRVWLSICPVVRASALGVGAGELGLTSSEPLYLPVSSKHTHTQDSHQHFCDICYHHLHLFLRWLNRGRLKLAPSPDSRAVSNPTGC